MSMLAMRLIKCNPYLDDLMEESGNDKRVLDLFTKDCHHRGITALYLTQDLFPPGKYSKTINRNVHYAICFKSPRDKTAIRNLLLQVYPDKWRRVLKLFLRLTARPFGYFMLHLHPASDGPMQHVHTFPSNFESKGACRFILLLASYLQTLSATYYSYWLTLSLNA